LTRRYAPGTIVRAGPRSSACGIGWTGRWTMPRALRVCVAVLSFLLARCGEDLAVLGPTPPGEGIIIFIHVDFAGSSQAINVDVRDLQKTEGPCSSGGEGETPSWRKCVSSVRVFPGWTATLYRDEDFKGQSVTLTADVPNLRELPGPCDGSFNDCARSIKVTKQ